jgi:hypothetical protein
MAEDLARAFGKALRHQEGGARFQAQTFVFPVFSALRLRLPGGCL